LSERIQAAGFEAINVFLHVETADAVLATIPSSAIVFNYCDGSIDHEFVLAQKVERRFPRMIGASVDFLKNTERKSVMTALLKRAGVPTPDTLRVTDSAQPGLRGMLPKPGHDGQGIDALDLFERNVMTDCQMISSLSGRLFL